MYKFLENWLNNLDIEELLQNINGRKCAIYCGGGKTMNG